MADVAAELCSIIMFFFEPREISMHISCCSMQSALLAVDKPVDTNLYQHKDHKELWLHCCLSVESA